MPASFWLQTITTCVYAAPGDAKPLFTDHLVCEPHGKAGESGQHEKIECPNRVITLSENAKLRFDPAQGRIAPESTSQPATPLDDDEAQMRRALGLDGGMPRPRMDQDRSGPASRGADRFTSDRFTSDRFSQGHRRRFVQDGDVPVTVVRRDIAADTSNRLAASGPSSSRLQRVETALAAETAARERAERQLSEAQAQIRDLQTKNGHAELARAEAADLVRREREALTELRASIGEQEQQREDAEQRAVEAERAVTSLKIALQEERSARHAAEKSLRIAEHARAQAEKLIEELSEQPDPVPVVASRPIRRPIIAVEPEVRPTPIRRGRPPNPVIESEPEPVKWWLTTKTAAKRR